MSRFFEPRQYVTLLTTGLRHALTGSRTASVQELETPGGADGSRHLLGASYGLTLSTIVAAMLFRSVEPAQFLFFTTTISMFFTATSVIGELAGGLFHPLDLAVTGHLPVSGFTRFSARFSELAVTLVLLTLNLNLAPAVLLFFMTGHQIAAPFVCLATAFCAALFTAGACLVAYGLLARFLSAAQFQGALLYVNIFVSLAILGLLLNIGPLIDRSNHAATGEWSLAFPPAWFAALALTVLGLPGGGGTAAWMALAGIAAALLPLAGAALGSESLLSALAAGGRSARGHSAPGSLMRTFARLCVRPEEKAAFEFTAVQLGRDRGFRLKAYPILGIPILIMTMSFFEAKDPLFYILMLNLMNLYLPIVLIFIPYSDHHQAAWIFESLPAKHPLVFSTGAEKAFAFRVMLPLLLLNAAVLAAIWSPLDGFIHAGYASLAGLFVVGARFRGLIAFPFSREFRGVLTGGLRGTLSTGFLILAVFVVLQFWMRDEPLILAAAAGGMLLLHKLRYTIFWTALKAKGAPA